MDCIRKLAMDSLNERMIALCRKQARATVLDMISPPPLMVVGWILCLGV